MAHPHGTRGPFNFMHRHNIIFDSAHQLVLRQASQSTSANPHLWISLGICPPNPTWPIRPLTGLATALYRHLNRESHRRHALTLCQTGRRHGGCAGRPATRPGRRLQGLSIADRYPFGRCDARACVLTGNVAEGLHVVPNGRLLLTFPGGWPKELRPWRVPSGGRLTDQPIPTIGGWWAGGVHIDQRSGQRGGGEGGCRQVGLPRLPSVQVAHLVIKTSLAVP